MGENKFMTYVRKFRLKEHSLGMAFIVLMIIATIVGWPNFLKVRNLTNILRQIPHWVIGRDDADHHQRRHDLSVGSMTAFVGGFPFFPHRFGPDSTMVSSLLFAPCSSGRRAGRSTAMVAR